MLSLQTVHLINAFSSGVEDQHSQNVMLHGIFTRLVMYDKVDHDPALFIETCLTLARLYWNENWAPAAVFFFMLTGFIIDDDAIVTLTTQSFPQLPENIRLDPNNVHGMCDLHCGILNNLWLTQDDDSDDDGDSESSGESDQTEESEESEESEPEEEKKKPAKKSKK